MPHPRRFFLGFVACLLVALWAGPLPAAIPQVAAGGIHALALGQDGGLLAWGDDGAGQLGIGRALVVAAPQAVPGLSLDPVTPNCYPPDAVPPFLLATTQTGDPHARTISTPINPTTADSGCSASSMAKSSSQEPLSLYVSAYAPAGAKTPICAPQTVQSEPTWWTLDPNGTWHHQVWPPKPFKDRLSDDYQESIPLVTACDMTGQTGTTIYVGLGTSADEMLSESRIRAIYTVQ